MIEGISLRNVWEEVLYSAQVPFFRIFIKLLQLLSRMKFKRLVLKDCIKLHQTPMALARRLQTIGSCHWRPRPRETTFYYLLLSLGKQFNWYCILCYTRQSFKQSSVGALPTKRFKYAHVMLRVQQEVKVIMQYAFLSMTMKLIKCSCNFISDIHLQQTNMQLWWRPLT